MLSNFKKRVRTDAHDVTGSTTPSETDGNVAQETRPHSQSDPRSSLPSSRSVTQVLYPPSYLGIRSPFPDPPPYAVQEDGPEFSPSSTTGIQGTHGRTDPLAEDPSFTGVPSQGTACSNVPSVEPNPPIVGFEDDLEDPLPAYSRFDQRRPRFPVASDVLGPYPPLSVLRQASH